ncbi:hypothetical protein [Pseudoalteromonas denitrificans]|uniref:Uncharacterized protein n=1 Tax=Pseudoalteromonas denitrificans DSM 6059 TaxID=1123010 RepID=A0A1I1HFN1_9GAMM|nr:hypothetical protein [Pseudoalteromonas denitrificans]SFC20798.1 hypothetical protein SAMN02745724_01123 [Pseudoalteromonas denitrificans DSM 6059]
MILKLNKKKLKNLSKDKRVFPIDMTAKVGGGSERYLSSARTGNDAPDECIPN